MTSERNQPIIGADLLNQLADAGLPLPRNCTGVLIEIRVDDVARIEVSSLVDREDGEGLTEVLKSYDLVKKIDDAGEGDQGILS